MAKTPTSKTKTPTPAMKSGGPLAYLLPAFVSGAAAFGTVFFLPDTEQPEPALCETDVAHAPKQLSDNRPPLNEINFVALDPLLISFGRASEARYLSIGLTLETSYGYEEDVEHAQPKLRDAFTGYLRALEMEQLEDPTSMVRLRTQLLRRAEIVLGSKVVHGVLVTDFLVR